MSRPVPLSSGSVVRRARYLDWLDEAADDYEVARLLCAAGKYSKACFFSHQACEKAVKAPMIRRPGRYDPAHSVAELLRRPLAVVDPIAPDGRPAAAELAKRAFSFTKAIHERLGAPEALRVVARG